MQRNGSRDSARVDWQEVSLQWQHTISILISICPIEHLFNQDADKEISSFVETDSLGIAKEVDHFESIIKTMSVLHIDVMQKYPRV